MRFIVEMLATAFLLCTVVGSGIMAQSLTSSVAIQLMINAFATISILYVLISLCSQLSGAHLNPLVTFVNVMQRKLSAKVGIAYIVAQVAGAITGTALAQYLFKKDLFEISTFDRMGMHLVASEVIATFGLVTLATAQWMKIKVKDRAALISLWIGGAYFFTSSTSFANPAVTLGRIFTESFAGISPQSVLPFIGAQMLGALIAFGAVSAVDSKEK